MAVISSQRTFMHWSPYGGCQQRGPWAAGYVARQYEPGQWTGNWVRVWGLCMGRKGASPDLTWLVLRVCLLLWAPLGALEGAAIVGRPRGCPPRPPWESLLLPHSGAQEGHPQQGDPLRGLPRLHL